MEFLRPSPSGESRARPNTERISGVSDEEFAIQLTDHLAVCWWAYRHERDSRILKGLNQREFRALPDKLDVIADDIERVNASYYGDPVRREAESIRLLSPSSFRFPEALEYTKEEIWSYYELPQTLRNYADRLRGPHRTVSEPDDPDEVTSSSGSRSEMDAGIVETAYDAGQCDSEIEAEIPSDLVGVRYAVRQGDLPRDVEFHLINLIEGETGKKHLSAAASLLLGVYCLQAKRPWSDEDDEGQKALDARFNAKSLEERFLRYREERKRPIPLAKFNANWILTCIDRE